MICCISPSATNFDESLNALKYANRVCLYIYTPSIDLYMNYN